ncbi:Ribosome maturation factor rimP [Syntrophobotulus glycolicus DSM 8271]|uniref:Ribosome maturation factor RimP n=1 Tax=Syntrophobotulus glycolicus (strain DSM 8271 / FlGlyR) TaxID=645991 RepID=F0SU94_SYNGF|nr:ribosome maturation factor RimP [Syntrophobotulus glycolicus]ADY56544.1 Ribosome maturation factor rimP [Syntrophobotulus glycolicus DSM 8271]
MGNPVIQKVWQIVEPITEELKLELVDVEYVKEGAHWYLRVYIDKDGGVDIDDCASVSHQLSNILDSKNLIPQAYMLEVSSPGIERPLSKREDYDKYIGKLVRVHTSEQFLGYTQFSGYLKGLLDEKVILEYEGQEAAIPINIVEKAHLECEF